MMQFLEEMIREAGTLVLSRYGESTVSYTKGNKTDIVTDADIAANDFIVGKIKKKYPDHGINSEESAQFQPDAEYQWIIDPIDGTVNFFRGTPLFSVSIAVAYKGEIISAAIFDPVHDLLYTAEKGKGAFENGEPIHCSPAVSLDGTYGCYPSKFGRKNLEMFGLMTNALYERNVWYTSFSSATINAMEVASGRRDWYISLTPKLWDLAAVALILAEAGCVVTTVDGKPWQLGDEGMLAGNKKVHKELLKILEG